MDYSGTFLCLQLKVVAMDGNLNVVLQENVHFDSELPEFRYQRFYSERTFL